MVVEVVVVEVVVVDVVVVVGRTEKKNHNKLMFIL